MARMGATRKATRRPALRYRRRNGNAARPRPTPRWPKKPPSNAATSPMRPMPPGRRRPRTFSDARSGCRGPIRRRRFRRQPRAAARVRRPRRSWRRATYHLAVVRLRFQVHGRTGYTAQKVGLVDAVEPRAVVERLAEPHVEVVVEVQATHPVVRHPGQREMRVGVR